MIKWRWREENQPTQYFKNVTSKSILNTLTQCLKLFLVSFKFFLKWNTMKY